jgi:hypothetical protein
MSKDKKEVKVAEMPKQKRYISEAIKACFTSKNKGRDVNLVDAMYSIADSIRGLRDELKKMNAAEPEQEAITEVPAEDDLSKDV